MLLLIRYLTVNEVSPSKNTVVVKNYNSFPLSNAEAFWNNNPVIHGRKIFALQNIDDELQEEATIADQRRVIVFDGNRWI